LCTSGCLAPPPLVVPPLLMVPLSLRFPLSLPRTKLMLKVAIVPLSARVNASYGGSLLDTAKLCKSP